MKDALSCIKDLYLSSLCVSFSHGLVLEAHKKINEKTDRITAKANAKPQRNQNK
jgi:hypothetical protein